MSIEATSAAGMNAGTAPAAAPKQSMDSAMFMKLLVAQLRNQDPSSPMSTNDMMAQQTQMASLEQLTNMSTTSGEQFALTMRMAAMNVVGKSVSYTGSDGSVVSGTATGASFAKSVPTINVGGTSVNLDSILSIDPTAV